MKRCLCLLFFSQIVFRDQALSNLQSRNPNTVISNFTETPAESNLNPNDVSGNQVLQQESSNRLAQDDTARFVVTEEHQRAKITPNDKASEITDGTRYIDSAEEIVRPGCHKEPVPCEEHVIGYRSFKGPIP